MKFDVLDDFEMIALCHFTNCKKLSGGAAMTGGMVGRCLGNGFLTTGSSDSTQTRRSDRGMADRILREVDGELMIEAVVSRA